MMLCLIFQHIFLRQGNSRSEAKDWRNEYVQWYTMCMERKYLRRNETWLL